MSELPTKVCATCGRTFAWRKRWKRVWPQVRFCSAACRQRKPGAQERRIERAILELVEARNGSVCPSEVARGLAGGEGSLRPWMEPVRQAARRLHQRGELQVLQRGQPVEPKTARGPIRLAKARGA
jgi:hypothetical protein